MSERIMGLDVGDKWIGVALSDELGILASAKPTLRRTKMSEDVRTLALLAEEWNVSEIVVGLPLNMNASVGPQAERTMALVNRLREAVACRVATWDERLSTRQAERLLIEQDVRREKRKKLVDGVAAALILESYLNSRAHSRREETHMADNDKDLMGTMGEEDDEIITLTDEDGNEHEFVVVDVIEVESQEYAILLPIDAEDDEEAEAVILRLEKDADGDDILVDIEAEEEWEKVAQAYEDLLEDESEE
ncbi:MAG: Holliday junction resolvase RuvX [Sulfobacillus sp.]